MGDHTSLVQVKLIISEYKIFLRPASIDPQLPRSFVRMLSNKRRNPVSYAIHLQVNMSNRNHSCKMKSTLDIMEKGVNQELIWCPLVSSQLLLQSHPQWRSFELPEHASIKDTCSSGLKLNARNKSLNKARSIHC